MDARAVQSPAASRRTRAVRRVHWPRVSQCVDQLVLLGPRCVRPWCVRLMSTGCACSMASTAALVEVRLGDGIAVDGNAARRPRARHREAQPPGGRARTDRHCAHHGGNQLPPAGFVAAGTAGRQCVRRQHRRQPRERGRRRRAAACRRAHRRQRCTTWATSPIGMARGACASRNVSVLANIISGASPWPAAGKCGGCCLAAFVFLVERSPTEPDVRELLEAAARGVDRRP